MNLEHNFELEMYDGKNLVQVIWTRILLGMNLEQNFVLEMYLEKTYYKLFEQKIY